MTQMIRARKADIFLGTMKLEVYQLPDGKYRLSQSQILERVEEPKNWISELESKRPEVLKGLQDNGFSGSSLPVKIENEPKARRAVTLSIPDTLIIWNHFGSKGNQIASALILAAASETIERRADKAFGVARTEEEYNQRFNDIFRYLIASNPEVCALSENQQIKISTPLHSFYDAVERKLRNAYKTGGIPGMSKESIRKEVAFLASHSPLDCWKLTPQQELRYTLGKLVRAKYPDLMSGIVPISVDGFEQKAVFIFQIHDLIVDVEDIEDCALARQYVRLAKEHLNVDHAFLFFVSPFGATPAAYTFIQTRLPGGTDGCKGCVGVLTIQELVKFFKVQALGERRQGLVKGEINKAFDVLNYRIPDSPLELLMNYQSTFL